MLRLFRADAGFQAYAISSERTECEEVQKGYHKESRNAVLEAEYWKGKAIINLQNTRRFY
jgi:hypothetical protein